MTSETADDVLARLDRQTREAAERARAAQIFRASLDALRGTAETDGVTATVDATGLLLGLDLPEDLRFRQGGELSQAVLTAVRAAQRKVADQVQEQAEAAYGAGSPSAERMRSELTSRFGVEPETRG